jgi:Resolvase, N terminal domain
MRVAVYSRTSTSKQSVTMLLKELRAYSQGRQWQIVEEFTDAGVSGGGHIMSVSRVAESPARLPWVTDTTFEGEVYITVDGVASTC